MLLPTRRKARIDGFDLDAEVAVHEHERDRLENLCRYVLRPPLALDRLKLLADDLVCIELKQPWRDGTTHVSMSPSVSSLASPPSCRGLERTRPSTSACSLRTRAIALTSRLRARPGPRAPRIRRGLP